MPQTTIYAAPRIGEQTPPAVATHELARLFGRSAALAGVSLSVERGAVVALLGPNGAGKTTLLRIVATALRPSFGSAEVDGIDVARRPDLVRGRIGYLSHATGLYDDLTAAENLRFAASMLGLPDGAASVDRALGEVGLTVDARRRVRGFSAGMRHRLALARLLLARLELVLLDEPHATLDADGMLLVDDVIGRWKAAGSTVLIASHQADRVSRLADGWARLDNGLLSEIGGNGVTALESARVGQPAMAGA
ncbi:MAG TPA: heme ABC exporter ATP-binding protein CcmA [Candidatus Limnocylindria bacterium]|jgi:heme exporter protein A|nr:heme ABC exporter ATP-binding protein CcmA [Candidatus Limnocylindria bacterium]